MVGVRGKADQGGICLPFLFYGVFSAGKGRVRVAVVSCQLSAGLREFGTGVVLGRVVLRWGGSTVQVSKGQRRITYLMSTRWGGGSKNLNAEIIRVFEAFLGMGGGEGISRIEKGFGVGGGGDGFRIGGFLLSF